MNAKRTPGKRSKIDKELAALRRMPDSEIDTSDIPEADAEFWANAKLVRHPKKVSISIRLDEDVVEWFRGSSNNYQSEINRVLRTYVEHKRGNGA